MFHYLQKSSKTTRIFIYVAGFSVGSELIWRYMTLWYKRITNFIKLRKMNKKINEAYCINEHSITIHCKNLKMIDGQHFCDNKHCAETPISRIISLIDRAENSIDLAMYLFYAPKLEEALKNANDRGVNIRIIGDKREAFKSESCIKELNLKCYDVEVRFHLTRKQLMHHKFCIIDGRNDVTNLKKNKKNDPDNEEIAFKPKPIMILGSINWTNRALYSSYDGMVVTTNQIFLQKYQTEFDRLWDYFDLRKEHDEPLFIDDKDDYGG